VKCPVVPHVAPAFLELECDLPVFQLFNAVVGDGNAAMPVPAGSQCVTQAFCQTWEGTRASRAALVRASLNLPRKSVESAQTGTS
jgi:hypothetical protein